MTTSLPPLTAAQSDHLDMLCRRYSERTATVLKRIAHSTVPVSNAELQQELGLNRTSLATLLGRLVDRRQIQRVHHGLYLRDPFIFAGLVPEILAVSPD